MYSKLKLPPTLIFAKFHVQTSSHPSPFLNPQLRLVNLNHSRHQLPRPQTPVQTSCRKKNSDDATFLQDIKEHLAEFVNASMDEHITCFKKAIQKVSNLFRFLFKSHLMFGMSKVVAVRNAEQNATVREVETLLPLKTTVAD
ncbi:hypothetical protein IFM89_013135 [Coptis chinensis]|uniref:Uncharacterized protein n=1 Tax=Coptis chinensis TaxID=261450 RepID=A0A835MB47_9MAGN|nr:hypothetical protein IFM89_013135 [Coptis chinensis]